MNFDFNPQQYEFRDAFASYLGEQYTLDRHRTAATQPTIHATLWGGLTELGLFGMLVAEAQGGLGLGFVDLALPLEELGKALVPAVFFDTLVATDLIVRYGTASQRDRLLPALAAGKVKVAIAATEIAGGFGPEEIATAAVASRSGWRLTGTKIMVPHTASEDLLLVLVRFQPGGELGLVLIEPGRSGISIRAASTLDLVCRFDEVGFDSVELHSADVLGGAASADAVARLMDVSAAVAALQLTGIAGRMLDISVAYAAQRTQFGKPIGSFQAIKHRCADMAVSADAARTAAYYAGWAIAEDAADRIRACSIAKSFCGDAARFVCNEAIQVHGGMGFTWELGLHHYLRRAKVLEYSWGDAAYHRERVIAATLSAQSKD